MFGRRVPGLSDLKKQGGEGGGPWLLRVPSMSHGRPPLLESQQEMTRTCKGKKLSKYEGARECHSVVEEKGEHGEQHKEL